MAVRGCLLDELNRINMESKQLCKLTLEKNAAMNVIASFVSNKEKKVATAETSEELRAKAILEPFTAARWNWVRSTSTGENDVKLYIQCT